MPITTTLVTFNGNAQQLAAAPDPGKVRKLIIEPLRANAGIMSIGGATVTIDGSGTGVAAELAAPNGGTGVLDRFVDEDQGGANNIDPLQYYVRGTSTQKCKVTYLQS